MPLSVFSNFVVRVPDVCYACSACLPPALPVPGASRACVVSMLRSACTTAVTLRAADESEGAFIF